MKFALPAWLRSLELSFPIPMPARPWLLFLAALGSVTVARPSPSWLPPGLPPAAAEGPTLCPRDYLTPEQGEALLRATLEQFPDAAAWQGYARLVRQRIQEGAGLSPWPRRTALNPIAHSRRVHDGYSVENVAFESIPGVWAAGNLYRPIGDSTRRPAVLTTHGHTGGVDGPTGWERHGRFGPSVQTRAAMLARAGAVVLTLDAFGYGDSLAQFGPDAHRTPLAMRVQVWNAVRALDFLSSLPEVDATRIGVTGESGGGTQTFLLTALDERVTAAAPVVMVSSYFFGGCPCESGRAVHRSPDHFASNAVITALAAPRPLLVVSDGKDWTQHVPRIEFPFLQEVYRRLGAADAVLNVHLADEGHDYGPGKRAAVYPFFGDALGLDLAVLRGADGAFDESRVTIEPAAALRTFNDAHPLPAGALREAAVVEQRLDGLQAPAP